MPSPPDGSCSRRRFFETLGGLALTAVPVPPNLQTLQSSRLGIQLYTLRDALARDFSATLAAIAGIGYTEVEFAGLHGRPARAVRRMLDELDLRAPAGHYPLEAVAGRLERTAEEARVLGHAYVIVPWLPDSLRTPDGYARAADLLNRAGERLRSAGLRLAYHNHAFEFASLAQSPIGYDILLRQTEPALVAMELDLYWIRQGGGNALDYFREHRGRFRCVHVKDMATDGSMVDVGAGVMDWPALLTAARASGVRHFFVEHDGPADALAFAQTSYQYLRRLSY
jgi:sugar phosphate isomerase/epimerase